MLWTWLSSRHRSGEPAFAVWREPCKGPTGELDPGSSTIMVGLREGDRFWRTSQRASGNVQAGEKAKSSMSETAWQHGEKEGGTDNAGEHVKDKASEEKGADVWASKTDAGEASGEGMHESRRTRRSPSGSEDDAGEYKTADNNKVG